MARSKGQDNQVKIYRDGALEKTFLAADTTSFGMDLQMEAVGYAGEAGDRVSGRNGNPFMTLSFDPDSTAFVEIMDAQRRKNLPYAHDEYAPFRIDVSSSWDFGQGGRSRVLLADCTLHDASLANNSRTDGFVKGSATFTTSADKFQRLA